MFLGTAAVLNRRIDRKDRRDIKGCIWFSTIELLFGGLMAFFVLFSVIITFANGFWSSACSQQGLAFVPAENMCDEINLGEPARLQPPTLPPILNVGFKQKAQHDAGLTIKHAMCRDLKILLQTSEITLHLPNQPAPADVTMLNLLQMLSRRCRTSQDLF